MPRKPKGAPPLDDLTRAHSRAAFDIRLPAEIDRAKRNARPLSLLVLDVNHFKSVNDAFGHSRGNQVLVELVARLRQAGRGGDLIFRYGGDEFAVLLPGTGGEGAEQVAQRMLACVGDSPFGGDPPLSVSISVGAAVYPEDGRTPEALFATADRRYYQARRQGRGGVVAGTGNDEATVAPGAPSRLLEREPQLEVLQRYLDALPAQGRGALQVQGPPQSGRSAFLGHARAAAHLRGHGILWLRGHPARRLREFGCLDEAQPDLGALPRASSDAAAYTAALLHTLRERRHTGLVIVIDDPEEVDAATLAFVRALLGPGLPMPVGIISAESRAPAPPRMAGDNMRVDTVALAPLSAQGAAVWLRHTFHWDFPAPFVDWFWRYTRGLPGLMQHATDDLVAQRLLTRQGDGWLWEEELLRHPPLERRPGALADTCAQLLGGQHPLIGRTKELLHLEAMLAQHRLVTVTGPGGTGKTRLTRQVAAEHAGLFEDDVRCVSLTDAGEGDWLVYAFAEAIGLTLNGPQAPQSQLLACLADKRMLFALDLAEGALDAAALVTGILHRAPGVRLLIAARERLGVPDERVLELGGLDTPPDGSPDPDRSDAVRFFVAVARRAHADFTPDPAEYALVARICRLVDGSPLGIELAAAWVPSLTLAELAESIERRSTLLPAGHADARSGLLRLHAVFDSLWAMLGSGEQAALMQMSMFQGGFRADVAQALAGVSPFFLDALAGKALLKRQGGGRLSLHEMLRHFAAAELEDHPELHSDCRRRFPAYFQEWLVAQEPQLLRGRSAVEALLPDLPNLRLAWDLALQHGDFAGLQRGLKTFLSLHRSAGLLQQGAATIASALVAVRPAASGGATVARRLLGLLLSKQSEFLGLLARFDEAIASGQESLALAIELDDRALEVAARSSIGSAEWYLGRFDAAREALRRSLALAREHGLRHEELDCLRYLGAVEMRQNHFLVAEGLFSEALAGSRALEYRLGEAMALNNLGSVYLELHRHTDSKASFEQALAILHAMGERWLVSLALNNLGAVTELLGEYSAARQYGEQSLQLKQRVGDVRGIGTTLGNLGFLAQRLGLLDLARADYARSLEISRTIGFQWNEALILGYLASLDVHEGRLEAALELSRSALDLARRLGDKSIQALALTWQAHALAPRDAAAARTSFEEALALRLDLGQHHFAAECRAGLARLSLEQGDLAGALALVAQVQASMRQHPLAGASDPMLVYVTCYDVLDAGGQTRAATDVLHEASAALEAQAARITDPVLRQSFLAATPARVRVRHRAQSLKPDTTPS